MILVLDIDGIFTDGKHYYTKDGKLLKSFGSNDRFILKLLQSQNIFDSIFCLTGDKTGDGIEISRRRLEKEIGLDVFSTHEEGGVSKYDYLIQRFGNGEKKFISEKVFYIGDDIADLKLISFAKWSATVNNAPLLVKKHVDYVSIYNGGEGGLSDILVKIMEDYGINLENLIL